MSTVGMPAVKELADLVIVALGKLGGGGTTAEIRQQIDRSSSLTSEQRAEKHGSGPGTEVDYRVRWALVDLRRKGLIERTAPRSWRLTNK